MYEPKPVETEHIELPEEVMALCERLAKNTHECWARQRMNEGWRYGPVRDDGKKLHPCLIPYEELPESEKEYDRLTAMESLKLVYCFGFSIRRSE